ncbi:MAG: FKBP-type peptidyl-prolyl cis-trans isomerase [Muribaculaceae bacterium]|nr:FKBP-type peptidyl-prolyl cis-trans isomerase [Muribaculaceae bacterium]
MKKLFSLLMVALLVGAMASCNGNKSGTSKTSKLEDSISLQIGELIGSQIKMMQEQQGLDPNEILKGLEAAAKLVKNDTSKSAQAYNEGLMMGVQFFRSMTQQEQMVGKINQKALLDQIRKTVKSKDSVDMAKMQQMQMGLQGMMMRAMDAKGKENDKAGQKYIQEQIKKDKGFKPLANGIYYKVIKPGNGENFNDSATVDIKYVGKHINGKVFDDSKGKTVPMSMKMTIPGFKEVVTKMKPGEKGVVIIPGAQAYKEQGNPQGGIAPMETLVFEIEAVGVHKEEPKAMPGMPGNPGAPAPKAAPGKPAPATKPVKK